MADEFKLDCWVSREELVQRARVINPYTAGIQACTACVNSELPEILCSHSHSFWRFLDILKEKQSSGWEVASFLKKVSIGG